MTGWSTFVRQATALCLLLAVALAVVLLTVTHQVQRLEEDLGKTRKEVSHEQQRIRILQAEFSYLAEPERLRRLAGAHLGLSPVEPEQLASFAGLDDAIRARQGTAVGKPVTGPVQLAHSRERKRARAAVQVAVSREARR